MKYDKDTQTIIPQKLKTGDEIRVIAPARSFRSNFVEKKLQDVIKFFKNELGLTISLGKHVFESNDFDTASLDHRLEDFHSAFSDPSVKGILTVLGGAGCNQMLRSVDWELVRQSPTKPQGLLRIIRRHCSRKCNLHENGSCNLFRAAFYCIWSQ